VLSGKTVAQWAALCDRTGVETARDDLDWWK